MRQLAAAITLSALTFALSGTVRAAPAGAVAGSEGCVRLSLVSRAEARLSPGETLTSVDVVADGAHAVVLDEGFTARVVDLTHPGDLDAGERVELPWRGEQIAGVRGRRALIRGDASLAMLDFRDGQTPAVVALAVAGAELNLRWAQWIDDRRVVALGTLHDEVRPAGLDGILLLDIGKPRAVRVTGALELPGARAAAASGGRAYFLQAGRLWVVDLPGSGPPTRLGQLALPAGDGGATIEEQLVIDGDIVLVSLGGFSAREPERYGTRLVVVDARSASAPRVLGELDLGGATAELTDLGDDLFLVGGDAALDLTVPGAPTVWSVRAPIGLPAHARARMHGGRLLVTGFAELLRVYDVRRDTPCFVRPAPPHAGRPAARARLHLPLLLRREPRQLPRPLEVDPVGQSGGSLTAAALDGHTAFLGVGAGLRVEDLADPGRPLTLAEGLPLAGAAARLVRVGRNLVAVTPWGTVQVLDVADPARPRELARLQGPSGVRAVLPAGDRLVLVGAERATVLELGGTTAPRVAVSAFLPAPSAAYAVAGGRLYAVDASGLWQLDLATGEARQHEGLDLPGAVTLAAGTAERLYVSQLPGLTVVDVTDPAGPRIANRLGLSFTAMVVEDRLLYAMTYLSQNLDVFSLDDPDRPARIGSLSTGGASILAVSADRLLLTGSYGGAPRVVDSTLPSQPRPGAWLAAPWTPARVVVHGDIVIAWDTAAAGWHVVDASRPEALTELEPFQIPDRTPQAVNGYVTYLEGDTLYLAARGDDGRQLIDVIDLAEPRRPRLLRSLPLDGEREVVAMTGDGRSLVLWRAQPGGSDPGLTLVDPGLAPPRHLLGHLEASDWAPESGHVAAYAGFVYAAAGEGIAVVDAREPGQLRRVGGLAPGSRVLALRVEGGRLVALTALGDEFGDPRPPADLTLYELRTPEAPRRLGRASAGRSNRYPPAPALDVSARLAVAASALRGLDLVDLSDPGRPRRLAEWWAGGGDWDPGVDQLALAGDRLFVTTPLGGLIVFDLAGVLAGR